MIVVVRFFARARDLAGTASASVEMPTGVTIKELRARLQQRFPALQGLLERSALAVGDEFADDDTVLTSNVEVAMLPPVSGG